MGSKKREALTEFNKTQILSAARILFEQKGIQATTVDEITKEADISKSTLYVYFKSKDEILYHIILSEFQTMKEQIQQCLQQEQDFKSTYHSICNLIYEYQKQSPVFFECLLSHIEVNEQKMKKMPVLGSIYEVGEQINDQIAKLLDKGIKSGEVREDMPIIPTVFFLWSSISEAVRFANEKSDYLKIRLNMSKKEYLDYSFDLILHAIEK